MLFLYSAMNKNITHELKYLRGLLKGSKKLNRLKRGWKKSYLIKVLAVYLVLDFALNLLIGFPLVTLLEDYYNTYEEFTESPLELILLGAILVPIIEELIFRAPMTLAKRNIRSTHVLFWLLTSLFALLHISNYDFNTIPLWAYPIMVIPQFITGILLGMVRIRFGLRYSMILHGSFNFVLLIPEIIWPQ